MPVSPLSSSELVTGSQKQQKARREVVELLEAAPQSHSPTRLSNSPSHLTDTTYQDTPVGGTSQWRRHLFSPESNAPSGGNPSRFASLAVDTSANGSQTGGGSPGSAARLSPLSNTLGKLQRRNLEFASQAMSTRQQSSSPRKQQASTNARVMTVIMNAYERGRVCDVPALVALLHSSDAEVLRHAARAVSNMSTSDRHHSDLLDSGVVPPLVQLCVRASSVDIMRNAVRALCYLSNHNAMLERHVDARLTDALVLLLEDQTDADIIKYATKTLSRVVSSRGVEETGSDRMIIALAKCCTHPDAHARFYMVSTFRHMASDRAMCRRIAGSNVVDELAKVYLPVRADAEDLAKLVETIKQEASPRRPQSRPVSPRRTSPERESPSSYMSTYSEPLNEPHAGTQRGGDFDRWLAESKRSVRAAANDVTDNSLLLSTADQDELMPEMATLFQITNGLESLVRLVLAQDKAPKDFSPGSPSRGRVKDVALDLVSCVELHRKQVEELRLNKGQDTARGPCMTCKSAAQELTKKDDQIADLESLVQGVLDENKKLTRLNERIQQDLRRAERNVSDLEKPAVASDVAAAETMECTELRQRVVVLQQVNQSLMDEIVSLRTKSNKVNNQSPKENGLSTHLHEPPHVQDGRGERGRSVESTASTQYLSPRSEAEAFSRGDAGNDYTGGATEEATKANVSVIGDSAAECDDVQSMSNASVTSEDFETGIPARTPGNQEERIRHGSTLAPHKDRASLNWVGFSEPASNLQSEAADLTTDTVSSGDDEHSHKQAKSPFYDDANSEDDPTWDDAEVKIPDNVIEEMSQINRGRTPSHKLDQTRELSLNVKSPSTASQPVEGTSPKSPNSPSTGKRILKIPLMPFRRRRSDLNSSLEIDANARTSEKCRKSISSLESRSALLHRYVISMMEGTYMQVYSRQHPGGKRLWCTVQPIEDTFFIVILTKKPTKNQRIAAAIPLIALHDVVDVLYGKHTQTMENAKRCLEWMSICVVHNGGEVQLEALSTEDAKSWFLGLQALAAEMGSMIEPWSTGRWLWEMCRMKNKARAANEGVDESTLLLEAVTSHHQSKTATQLRPSVSVGILGSKGEGTPKLRRAQTTRPT